MDNIPGLSNSQRNSLQEDTIEVGIALLTAASSSGQQCVLDLYATPIVYYVCGVRVQQIHEIISSKLSIRKILDPR